MEKVLGDFYDVFGGCSLFWKVELDVTELVQES